MIIQLLDNYTFKFIEDGKCDSLPVNINIKVISTKCTKEIFDFGMLMYDLGYRDRSKELESK